MKNLWLLSLLVLMVACGKVKNEAAPGADSLSMAPLVEVAPAIEKVIEEASEYSGRLEAEDTVDVRSRVAGAVHKVHFADGQEVKRGDLLVTIDRRPFQAELARAEAQWTAARSQSELAQSEHERGQKLLEIKGISQQEYDQLNTSWRNAQSNLKAAEAAVMAAKLNDDYAQIRAPFAGRVSRANVSVGSLVGNGEPILTTLISLDKVYAYFDVSESDYLNHIKTKTPSQSPHEKRLSVQMGLSNETGFPHKGEIDFVDNRLNPQTGGIRLRAVFANTQRQFTPGLFARVRLVRSGVEEQHKAVLVPDTAVGTDQTRQFVFVAGADGKAQYREVKLGARVDGMRVVLSGLQAGEPVVVKGLQRVRPGAPIQIENPSDQGKKS